jgi:hypothetical protein
MEAFGFRQQQFDGLLMPKPAPLKQRIIAAAEAHQSQPQGKPFVLTQH